MTFENNPVVLQLKQEIDQLREKAHALDTPIYDQLAREYGKKYTA